MTPTLYLPYRSLGGTTQRLTSKNDTISHKPLNAPSARTRRLINRLMGGVKGIICEGYLSRLHQPALGQLHIGPRLDFVEHALQALILGVLAMQGDQALQAQKRLVVDIA